MVVTNGSNTYTSAWTAQTPTQTSYDDMTTTPGGATTGGTTPYFSLMSGLSYTDLLGNKSTVGDSWI